MSVVTISYGSSDIRGHIADGVAQLLGYKLVGREVLKEASNRFNVMESKLSHAIHHGPTFFGMSDTTRKKYISYILAIASESLLQNEIVYHGPAGHIIAQGIPHILKVRLVSSPESRIAYTMDHNNLSRERAEQVVEKENIDRKKWASIAFGINDDDKDIYDLLICECQIGMKRTIETIVNAAREKKYKPMTYSMQCIRNKELSCRIQALLIDINQDIKVQCENGRVTLSVCLRESEKNKKQKIIQKRLETIDDVEHIEINIIDDMFDRDVGIMR